MGKYSKAGRSPRGERLNNSLVRRIGTLNCGHSAHPIVYGASIPQYTPEELEEMRQKNETGISFRGKHYTGYEATQRQRRLERAIRAQKRKILIDKATGDSEKLETDQIKLQLLQQDYKAFSKAAGLRTQHERLEKVGFGWKEAAAAQRAGATAETIGRTLGAKAKNYDIFNPSTGGILHLAEGTRITQPKNHIIAGAGRERQIDCIDWLVDKYGGDVVKWTKEKGFGVVVDEYGEFRNVELHWYQEPSVGKVEMKIKVKDGRWYIDD